MNLGIVGLPNVGKSTLFNAITQAGALSANYPFATIEPNIGVVSVPDERLGKLAEIFDSKRILPATVEFVDIAGLVEGASKGEGLGNKFLANIRETDAILHVVRCFDNDEIINVNATTNAKRDMEIINLELILADLEWLERHNDRLRKQARADKDLRPELDFSERLEAHLATEQPARTFDIAEDELEFTKQLPLLTSKPILYIANVSEDEIFDSSDNEHVQAVAERAASEGAEYLTISAQIEEEISALEAEERQLFLEDLGLEESGLDRIIKASYELLGLISYLTAGPQETRAWTIKNGTLAPQAAGKIHSDFERGFIRAEVVAAEDLFEQGSMAKSKEKGLVRSEGKDYMVKDGDVILFRFNV